MTNEELVIEYQAGNKDALKELYTQNIGMIEKIIRRYSGIEELDDLRQEAYFGIVKAADLWKTDKECSFITYAIYWIRQVILHYIAECGGVIRIPSHRRALMQRYNRALNSYRALYGCNPSGRELCTALDISTDQLEELQKDLYAVQIRSTSEVIGGEDDDLTLEDTLSAEGDQMDDVIDCIQQEELSSVLWSCVDELPDQEADVIRRNFKEGMTLEECGAVLGVSGERARQIKGSALRTLRKPYHTKRLRPFLTEEAAHSLGLRHTGMKSFEQYGSSQEYAMMCLEQLAGMSLWNGREVKVIQKK